jgi:hypothetical protein
MQVTIPKQLKDNLLLILLLVVIFLGGFFLGTKYQGTANSQKLADNRVQGTLDSVSTLSQQDQLELDINTEVDYIYWIDFTKEADCPLTHPVKGKFNSDANVFYTPDNKFYNRVSPDICFTDEEKALELAKFIKKF